MEPTAPQQTKTPPPATQSPIQVTQQTPSSKFRMPPKKFIIIGSTVLILIIISIGMIIGGNTKQTANNSDLPKPSQSAQAPVQNIQTTPQVPDAENPSQIMVYGAWTGQTTVIKGVDLGSSNSFLIATLPLDVKKVSVLSSQTLLYIDQVDTKDHGKRITIYNVKNKSANITIPVSPGYGIDDYVLSPDKKYLTIWEVQFASGSQILQGGKSRVYAVDLARPTVKNLLYDESINTTTPIHYPRAILNDGTVFADTFMPNDPNGGAGWAYGMSIVDFDGKNKRDIDTMKSGTYGTQPFLSPDGKYLVFAGYDGTKGEGNANISGYRRALLTPNTVDVLNTQTLKRFTLPNLSNASTYSSVAWEVQTGRVILTVLSPTGGLQTGIYYYDLGAQKPSKIAVPMTESETYGYISRLNESKALIGLQDMSPSNLGNLGDQYSYAYTQIALMDVSTSKVSYVSLQDSFAQYITLLPTNYFDSVLGIKTMAQAVPQPTFIDLYSDKNSEKQNMQLYTFFLKAELSPQRLKQQSTPIQNIISPPANISIPPNFKQNKNSPTCEELAETQCSAQGVSTGSTDYKDCVRTNKIQNLTGAKFEGKCHDSPLYLYGKPGTTVRVKIQTPIYNAVPASNGEYAITLGTNGTMHIDDKSYKSIAYDYQSNKKRLTPPTYGTIVAKKDVTKVLKGYAAKLGLNTKETADLMQAGKNKVTSQYAFISFFDHEQSQQILPIAFSPVPDNYLNVVFYFKLYNEKPNFKPNEPAFADPIRRDGFTAVEVSEIVE